MALAAAAGGAAHAATFDVADETELAAAILAANASLDPSSTINIGTSSLTITSPLPQVGANVTVQSNGFPITIGSMTGASLDVQAGAGVVAANVFVGHQAGVSGGLTVQGKGAQVTGSALQSAAGKATIQVLDGATLTMTGPGGFLLGGTNTTSLGGSSNVAVGGQGSVLSANVGYYHHSGTLDVFGGGLVQAKIVALGASAGDVFTGTVTGAGSSLASDLTAITLGAAGTATLTVADGATLSANKGAVAINLATGASGVATLNIGGDAAAAPAAPGTVMASIITGGAGKATLNFNHNASAYEFSVPVGGSTAVNQLGSGTTVLVGDNAYTGGTTVAAGTLQVGNGGTSGTLGKGAVINNAALVFNRSDDFTVANAIGGSGSLSQSGAGTLTLDSANGYTGGTSVTRGTLVAGVTGALGSGPVNVATSGALSFTGTADAGSLVVTTGARDDALGLNGGFVQFRDDSTAGLARITAAKGAAIEFRDRATAGKSAIDNAGGVVFYETSSAGAGQITNRSGGDTTFFDNSSAGQATFTNAAGGLLDLFDNSTAAGATVINEAGGRVRISGTAAGTRIGSLAGDGNVVLGARTLTTGGLNTSTAVGGTISGSGGALVKEGTGTLTLSGANTYTGGTALKAGTLAVASNSALGTGGLAMDDGTTLAFAADHLTIANPITMTGVVDPTFDTGANTATLTGGISGAADLTKTGTGTLILGAANNTYTGSTTVAQGTLRAGVANAFSPASATTVAAGATLDLAGHSQALASVNNAGTVSLVGSTPGTVLTVTGPWVGNNGTLAVGTAVGNDASPTDRLVLSGAGAVASGSTRIAITNIGGLGGQTTGNGIAVVTAENGGSIGSGAFTLATPVSAGAYDYQLNTTGTGSYLTNLVPVVPVVPVVP
ncbi:MAG: autotransporter-associated beta strand repeat-containing protein, partial [Rhodocyclaceae bacterium]|nr:autotransporter-associated beta strand repeat-containing protein [Rhodocyclaceae bacterium]